MSKKVPGDKGKRFGKGGGAGRKASDADAARSGLGMSGLASLAFQGRSGAKGPRPKGKEGSQGSSPKVSKTPEAKITGKGKTQRGKPKRRDHKR